METAYRVHIEVFEGPLDLLYHLVEEEEIDIWDIPISHITKEYLAYLDTMRQLDIDVAGEFLVMAARLLFIKARMLLPEEPDEDEAEEGEDPRLSLAFRLLEYKMFKEAAAELSKKAEGRWDLFPRPEGIQLGEKRTHYVDPAANVTLFDLSKAFRNVLEAYRPPGDIPVPFTKVSVPEKVLVLRRLFSKKRRMRFNSLFKGAVTKPEVIATFLALLELIRQGTLFATQAGVFGSILIHMREAADRGEDQGGALDAV